MAYIKSLFSNCAMVTVGTIGGTILAFLFPESIYLTSFLVVLGIMVLDLLTKIYALSKQNKGLRAAFKSKAITSKKFGKGTMDKLIVLFVFTLICAAAYKLSPISSVAAWFMQVSYTVMFLRDVLSIIENLTEAGVSGLSMFKKIIKKKTSDYIEEKTGLTKEEQEEE